MSRKRETPTDVVNKAREEVNYHPSSWYSYLTNRYSHSSQRSSYKLAISSKSEQPRNSRNGYVCIDFYENRIKVVCRVRPMMENEVKKKYKSCVTVRGNTIEVYFYNLIIFLN